MAARIGCLITIQNLTSTYRNINDHGSRLSWQSVEPRISSGLSSEKPINSPVSGLVSAVLSACPSFVARVLKPCKKQLCWPAAAMGGVLSLFKKPKKILILGPPKAGKTTILQQISTCSKFKSKIADHRRFNLLRLKNYNIWDLKGETDPPSSWLFYYDNTAGIIFLYDSERSELSERLLKRICFARELRNVPILLVLNKLQTDMDTATVRKIIRRRAHSIVKIVKDQKQLDIRTGIEWLLRMA